ncbi:hypothetical protein CPLU01_01833 [Colletotrichum plurivorum]|uniref:Uncharacterized protein n=1 Tax=Colletotrichum plurivorum TaxID=2175906 RepID=A0A8H6KY48_9PEZI|nr:hypothetical protein CPLU01_01833 [Colletotrichum plurivorum]
MERVLVAAGEIQIPRDELSGSQSTKTRGQSYPATTSNCPDAFLPGRLLELAPRTVEPPNGAEMDTPTSSSSRANPVAGPESYALKEGGFQTVAAGGR